MQNKVFYIIVIIGLLLSGCALDPGKKETPASFEEPNSYYYYTAAQMAAKDGDLDTALSMTEKALSADSRSRYLRREAAGLYLKRQENEKTLSILEGILKEDPEDIDTLIMYGRVLQLLKKRNEAKKIFERVIALDGKRKKIYLMLGGMYLQDGEENKAKDVFMRMVKRFPGTYAGHFFLGRIFLQQGRYQAAEREYRKAIKLEPEILDARFELVEIYKKKKGKGKNRTYHRKIVRLYEDILAINPKSVKALIGLGYYYHIEGQKAKAGKYFKKLGEMSETDFNVIVSIVGMLLDQKKYRMSVVVLNGMLEGAPNSSEIHHILGTAYNALKKKQKALFHFRKVQPGSRFFQDAVVHSSYLFQEMGRVSEGIAFIKALIKKMPDNPQFYFYLGILYEDMEAYDQAEKTFHQGLAIDPENVRLHFRLGVVLDKNGKKEACMEAMKKVIQLDPKHANALNYLGYTYADMGTNLDEAERLIKEALKHRPNDGYVTDSLGWVYYKKGLYQKAVDILEQAVKLVPDDPIILEHLGDAYLKINNTQKALEFYRRSLSKKKKKKEKEALKQKIKELDSSTIKKK